MTETDLEGQRATLAGRLANHKPPAEIAELVRKADAALAEHKSVSAALESQIGELDAQLDVREKDRRDAAAAAKEAAWRERRQALVALEDKRLTAVADAEAACGALVDAISNLLETNAVMAVAARELSASGRVPMALSTTDLVNRMAGRIATAMTAIRGHRFRFGMLEWVGGTGSLYPPGWREQEEKRMSAEMIGPLLEMGTAR